MAQLKDLLVTGASRLIGDAYTNTIQITSLKAPTSAGGSTYGTGTNGQVLLSNGSSIYWGSAAPTVTESTVSGWGFTKNTGTITGATANKGLTVSGTTLGHSNSVTAQTTQAIYPIKIDAQGHISAYGTAVTPLTASSTLDATKLSGTIPTSCYTDTNNAVTQTATSTNADYEVLFSVTADNTTRTEGARKNSNLKFNPSTGNLIVTKINGVTVGSTPKFTDTVTTVTTSGSGNAITAISASNGVITATKGTTFLTSHQDISGKVNKSGDTMSGNLIVQKASTPEVIARDSTTNGLAISLLVGSGHQSHGIYSTGYATDANLTNNTYTASGKWLVYRDKTGEVILNGTANKATADSSGNNIVDTYVNKSGDTMTGNLDIKTSAITIGTAPSSSQYSKGIMLRDSTDALSGMFRYSYASNDTLWTQMIATRKVNNSDIYNTFSIGIDKNGNYTAWVSCPDALCSAIGAVKKAGDTMTGKLSINTGTNPDGNTWGQGVQIWHDSEGGNIGIYAGKAGNQTDNYYYEIDAYDGYLRCVAAKNGAYLSTPCWISPTQGLFGAVWNDYAEFRKDNEKEKDVQQPGRCIKENGDGTLSLTTKRLERGCEIISDTFGFSIGYDKENGCNTPIASSGRVLAYPYESIEEFTNHIGWPVCSGPNGTVSIMTEEEEEKYPSRIIGTISEIPSYEEWGTGKVKVNGRIWIRIK